MIKINSDIITNITIINAIVNLSFFGDIYNPSITKCQKKKDYGKIKRKNNAEIKIKIADNVHTNYYEMFCYLSVCSYLDLSVPFPHSIAFYSSR